jgi:glycosyltransferase involved in cell wall biosynthesis
MALLLENEDAAREMGRRARHRVVAEYSWTRHCERLEAVLEEAARAHGTGVRR